MPKISLQRNMGQHVVTNQYAAAGGHPNTYAGAVTSRREKNDANTYMTTQNNEKTNEREINETTIIILTAIIQKQEPGKAG